MFWQKTKKIARTYKKICIAWLEAQIFRLIKVIRRLKLHLKIIGNGMILHGPLDFLFWVAGNLSLEDNLPCHARIYARHLPALLSVLVQVFVRADLHVFPLVH